MKQKKIYDIAIEYAQEVECLCTRQTYISSVADIFCYKELYSDVARIMNHSTFYKSEQKCAFHPYAHYLVPYEIQIGNLEKAFEFATQINITADLHCALDDVMEAYAQLGDIENVIYIAKEFTSKKDLAFSIVFSLCGLANYLYKSNTIIPCDDYKQFKMRLLSLLEL